MANVFEVELLLLAVVGMFAGYTIWWNFGTGALERRKKARQEVWLNVHAAALDRARGAVKRDDARSPVDREALEREIRRYD